MEKLVLDRETVTKLMEEVVAEKGEDYTLTDGCRYIDDHNEPVCIVGHVLVKAGLDTDFFKQSYDSYGSTLNSTSFAAVMDRVRLEVIEMPSEVVEALSCAQRAQDGYYGNPLSWGEALETYKESLEYYDDNQEPTEVHEVPC